MKKSFRRRRAHKKPRSRKTLGAILGLFLIALVFCLIVFARIVMTPFGGFVSATPQFINSDILLLLQNEAEIRPTGGFLSAIGILEIRSGQPHLILLDSYAITDLPETPRAPAAITEVFSVDPKFTGWKIRDANFDPDFARSVAHVALFLGADEHFRDRTFDAVVAVNFDAVEDILVTLLGEDDARLQTLFLDLQRESKDVDLHSIEELAQRKNGLVQLADEALSEVGLWNLPSLLDVMGASADAKDIQMYFDDSELQQNARNRYWTGELPKEDFFSVNVANLGAKKSDYFTRRRTVSEWDIDAFGSVAESLSVELIHGADPSLLSGSGQYYVRVLRPLGTVLLPDQPDWAQKTLEHHEEFSTRIAALPGQNNIADVQFQLPFGWEYGPQSSLWVAQSGADERIELIVRASGEQVLRAMRGCNTLKEGDVVLFCDFELQNQHQVSFDLTPDTLSPIIEQMVFRPDGELFVRFSEEVSFLNSFAGTLQCDDTQHAITGFNPQGRDVVFAFAPAVTLDDSFCQLSLVDISDLFGNKKPIQITLPMRQP